MVEGAKSAARELSNSVFQGTVWGPPLWNCFYADASRAVSTQGFSDIVFADDLNCAKILGAEATNVEAIEAAKSCQRELHKWGEANQVLFDAGKESIHVIHRTRGEGGNFVILGIEFDTALVMHDAAKSVAIEAGWRLKTLLRTRRFHTRIELMRLYKSQILSYIESRTAGLHHASASVLACIDGVQRRFLREIHVSSLEALRVFKLAPLACRRAMSMLGFLYRVVHGFAPACLCQLFAQDLRVRESFGTRRSHIEHDFRLMEMAHYGGHTETFRRSVFGLITVWNMLPVDVVRSPSVKTFQRRLQAALAVRAAAGKDWEGFFDEARRMPAHRFQQFLQTIDR